MIHTIKTALKNVLVLSVLIIPLISCEMITLNKGDLANEEKTKKELKEKENELNEKEKELNSKSSELLEKEERLSDKENQLNEKNTEINNKENELSNEKNELSDKENELKDKEKRLTDKEEKLSVKEDKISDKEDDLSERENELKKEKDEFLKEKEREKENELAKQREKEQKVFEIIYDEDYDSFYEEIDNKNSDSLNNNSNDGGSNHNTVNENNNSNQNENKKNTEDSEKQNITNENSNEQKNNSNEESNSSIRENTGVQTTERNWNILIYMPADNNLESSALEDIYEMECSNLNTDCVSVFMLLDRSNAYDTSEKNWSGTRLYRLKTGRKSENRQMISEEIPCIDLGLEVGKETELDMSSDYVLGNCLNYLRKKFPANNYGLIMWGHGTGWRSGSNDNYISTQLTKGFAFDETSKTYMTLPQLGNALNNAFSGGKLNFIGFDTCFGGEIEVAYELKDCVDYIIGSEGLVMSSGWNYTNLFNEINSNVFMESSNVCDCIVGQFKNEYSNTGGASIVAVKTSEIERYFEAIDNFMLETANLIINKKIRDEIIGLLFSNKNCDSLIYTYGTENSDVYLDISSLIDNCYSYFENDYYEKLQPYYQNYVGKRDSCVINSWSFDSDDNNGNLGIFFSTITTGKLLSSFLPTNYIKGKTLDQIMFVKNSNGYVPTKQGDTSFLDKLFYTKFN